MKEVQNILPLNVGRTVGDGTFCSPDCPFQSALGSQALFALSFPQGPVSRAASAVSVAPSPQPVLPAHSSTLCHLWCTALGRHSLGHISWILSVALIPVEELNTA